MSMNYFYHKTCLYFTFKKPVGYLGSGWNFPSSLGSREMELEDKTDFGTKLGNDWLDLAYVTV